MKQIDIIKYCSQYGFKRSYTGICSYCGTIFYSISNNAAFCSIGCGLKRGKKIACFNCHKYSYKCPTVIKKNKWFFCSVPCRDKYFVQSKHPQWKNGCINHGYRQLHLGNKKEYEHRYVMERHLGRELKYSEHIHHKDRNKLNNSIGNLQIMTQSEHSKLHHPKKTIE